MSLKPTTDMSSGQLSPARRQRVVAAERHQVVAGHDRGRARAPTSAAPRAALPPPARERSRRRTRAGSASSPGASIGHEALVALTAGQDVPGPPRWAIRAWPSSTRCSTASSQPRSSAAAEAASASSCAGTSTTGRPASASSSGRLQPRGGGDHSVDLARAHGVEVVALACGVVVGVGDQGRVAGRLEPVLDPAHDRREQRVGEVGDEDPDRVGAVGLEAAGDRVRPVAERLRDLDHAAGRLLVDEPPRLGVQRARHRPGVHVGEAGDVAKGRRGGTAGHARHHARDVSRSRTAPSTAGVASCVSSSSEVFLSEVTSRSSGSVPPAV